jgi:hypothetical protein
MSKQPNTNNPHSDRCSLERVQKLEAVATILRYCALRHSPESLSDDISITSVEWRVVDAQELLGMPGNGDMRDMLDAVDALFGKWQRFGKTRAKRESKAPKEAF